MDWQGTANALKASMSPTLLIVAGPNGAGKTTFAQEFLPYYADCKSFINADLIAAGISPFSPDLVAVKAGRIMLQEIKRLSTQDLDFGFETTFAGTGYLRTIRAFKARGYAVHIFFLWVLTVGLALSRVKERVSGGGHNIPDATVERRYTRSIQNFLRHYRELADSWILFDNSGTVPTVIAERNQGKLGIIDQGAYDSLVALYGDK